LFPFTLDKFKDTGGFFPSAKQRREKIDRLVVRMILFVELMTTNDII